MQLQSDFTFLSPKSLCINRIYFLYTKKMADTNKTDPVLIQVYASVEEKEMIEELAKKDNRSVSSYMKLKSLNKI